ncbi:type II toxin-antitoxin system antitoxin DNA ADP-ribosyl glycohydrolase DarG [Gracilibacillus phocaeensis]|uniref:type II toxin-antitoxin system antitoxin DNA ADP-ribosyl glycohydrolase DarG n=1 Tax=Gracilibacillus phocaeensis TaxID=2042304 RepID=UPI001031044B|nr:macro domain-containing protein [Gracilibacillus phocaeensis]
MIVYTTGDLLKSEAEVLVNTVNCEGYMGKGIAYQFKLSFPENYKDYVKACKSGDLQIGKLHYFEEDGKLIINFPTKNKWRAKSKMEYIEKGLDQLLLLMEELDIQTIAIPPLGAGNGGLVWSEVKQVIHAKLNNVDDNRQIYIYEPSQHYVSQPKAEPKLSLSSLVLMSMKHHLDTFDTLRLQKTAFFTDVFSGKNYFHFTRHKYGPYDNSIAIISREIKAFQTYHDVNSTEEAYRILCSKIVSDKVNTKLTELDPFVEKAAQFVNTIKQNHELECLSTITYLLLEKEELSREEIIYEFKQWSKDKANRFSEDDIIQGIHKLLQTNVLENTLMGYALFNDGLIHRRKGVN